MVSIEHSSAYAEELATVKVFYKCCSVSIVP